MARIGAATVMLWLLCALVGQSAAADEPRWDMGLVWSLVVPSRGQLSEATDKELATGLDQYLAANGCAATVPDTGDSLFVGVKQYVLGEYTSRRHAGAGDCPLTADIVRYASSDEAGTFWQTFYKSQWYSGMRDDSVWLYHTMRSDNNNAVGLVLRTGPTIINVRVGVSFSVPEGYAQLPDSNRAAIDTAGVLVAGLAPAVAGVEPCDCESELEYIADVVERNYVPLRVAAVGIDSKAYRAARKRAFRSSRSASGPLACLQTIRSYLGQFRDNHLGCMFGTYGGHP
ncbi:MAG: hypothetical protein GF331_00780, partial [Chitinivibrionales bacterium]|nr:hypothetical protein [Chitinivibrionales bacterium]